MTPIDKTYGQDYQDLCRGLSSRTFHNPASSPRGDGDGRAPSSPPAMPKDRTADALHLLVQALLAQAEEELGRRSARRSRENRPKRRTEKPSKSETP